MRAALASSLLIGALAGLAGAQSAFGPSVDASALGEEYEGVPGYADGRPVLFYRQGGRSFYIDPQTGRSKVYETSRTGSEEGREGRPEERPAEGPGDRSADRGEEAAPEREPEAGPRGSPRFEQRAGRRERDPSPQERAFIEELNRERDFAGAQGRASAVLRGAEGLRRPGDDGAAMASSFGTRPGAAGGARGAARDFGPARRIGAVGGGPARGVVMELADPGPPSEYNLLDALKAVVSNGVPIGSVLHTRRAAIALALANLVYDGRSVRRRDGAFASIEDLQNLKLVLDSLPEIANAADFVQSDYDALVRYFSEQFGLFPEEFKDIEMRGPDFVWVKDCSAVQRKLCNALALASYRKGQKLSMAQIQAILRAVEAKVSGTAGPLVREGKERGRAGIDETKAAGREARPASASGPAGEGASAAVDSPKAVPEGAVAALLADGKTAAAVEAIGLDPRNAILAGTAGWNTALVWMQGTLVPIPMPDLETDRAKLERFRRREQDRLGELAGLLDGAARRAERLADSRVRVDRAEGSFLAAIADDVDFEGGLEFREAEQTFGRRLAARQEVLGDYLGGAIPFRTLQARAGRLGLEIQEDRDLAGALADLRRALGGGGDPEAVLAAVRSGGVSPEARRAGAGLVDALDGLDAGARFVNGRTFKRYARLDAAGKRGFLRDRGLDPEGLPGELDRAAFFDAFERAGARVFDASRFRGPGGPPELLAALREAKPDGHDGAGYQVPPSLQEAVRSALGRPAASVKEALDALGGGLTDVAGLTEFVASARVAAAKRAWDRHLAERVPEEYAAMLTDLALEGTSAEARDRYVAAIEAYQSAKSELRGLDTPSGPLEEAAAAASAARIARQGLLRARMVELVMEGAALDPRELGLPESVTAVEKAVGAGGEDGYVVVSDLGGGFTTRRFRTSDGSRQEIVFARDGVERRVSLAGVAAETAGLVDSLAEGGTLAVDGKTFTKKDGRLVGSLPAPDGGAAHGAFLFDENTFAAVPDGRFEFPDGSALAFEVYEQGTRVRSQTRDGTDIFHERRTVVLTRTRAEAGRPAPRRSVEFRYTVDDRGRKIYLPLTLPDRAQAGVLRSYVDADGNLNVSDPGDPSSPVRPGRSVVPGDRLGTFKDGRFAKRFRNAALVEIDADGALVAHYAASDGSALGRERVFFEGGRERVEYYDARSDATTLIDELGRVREIREVLETVEKPGGGTRKVYVTHRPEGRAGRSIVERLEVRDFNVLGQPVGPARVETTQSHRERLDAWTAGRERAPDDMRERLARLQELAQAAVVTAATVKQAAFGLTRMSGGGLRMAAGWAFGDADMYDAGRVIALEGEEQILFNDLATRGWQERDPEAYRAARLRWAAERAGIRVEKGRMVAGEDSLVGWSLLVDREAALGARGLEARNFADAPMSVADYTEAKFERARTASGGTRTALIAGAALQRLSDTAQGVAIDLAPLGEAKALLRAAQVESAGLRGVLGVGARAGARVAQGGVLAYEYDKRFRQSYRAVLDDLKNLRDDPDRAVGGAKFVADAVGTVIGGAGVRTLNAPPGGGSPRVGSLVQRLARSQGARLLAREAVSMTAAMAITDGLERAGLTADQAAFAAFAMTELGVEPAAERAIHGTGNAAARSVSPRGPGVEDARAAALQAGGTGAKDASRLEWEGRPQAGAPLRGTEGLAGPRGGEVPEPVREAEAALARRAEQIRRTKLDDLRDGAPGQVVALGVNARMRGTFEAAGRASLTARAAAEMGLGQLSEKDLGDAVRAGTLAPGLREIPAQTGSECALHALCNQFNSSKADPADQDLTVADVKRIVTETFGQALGDRFSGQGPRSGLSSLEQRLVYMAVARRTGRDLEVVPMERVLSTIARTGSPVAMGVRYGVFAGAGEDVVTTGHAITVVGTDAGGKRILFFDSEDAFDPLDPTRGRPSVATVDQFARMAVSNGLRLVPRAPQADAAAVTAREASWDKEIARFKDMAARKSPGLRRRLADKTLPRSFPGRTVRIVDMKGADAGPIADARARWVEAARDDLADALGRTDAAQRESRLSRVTRRLSTIIRRLSMDDRVFEKGSDVERIVTQARAFMNLAARERLAAAPDETVLYHGIKDVGAVQASAGLRPAGVGRTHFGGTALYMTSHVEYAAGYAGRGFRGEAGADPGMLALKVKTSRIVDVDSVRAEALVQQRHPGIDRFGDDWGPKLAQVVDELSGGAAVVRLRGSQGEYIGFDEIIVRDAAVLRDQGARLIDPRGLDPLVRDGAELALKIDEAAFAKIPRRAPAADDSMFDGLGLDSLFSGKPKPGPLPGVAEMQGRMRRVAEDVLAARDPADSGPQAIVDAHLPLIEALPKEPGARSAAVAEAAARSLGLPGGLETRAPDTPALSGDEVFLLRRDGKPAAVAKVMRTSPAGTAAQELAAGGLFDGMGLKRSRVAKALGAYRTEDGEILFVMETAPGRDYYGVFREIGGAEGNERRRLYRAALGQVGAVARAMAEYHDGAPGDEVDAGGLRYDHDSGLARVRRLDQAKGALPEGFAVALEQRLAAAHRGAQAEEELGRVVHGDAHPGNFFIDDEGRVTMIDVETAVWSVGPGGAGKSAAAADIARFLESIAANNRVKGLGLSAPEIAGLRKAFQEAYEEASGRRFADFAAQLDLYAAKLHVTALSAAPDAAAFAGHLEAAREFLSRPGPPARGPPRLRRFAPASGGDYVAWAQKTFGRDLRPRDPALVEAATRRAAAAHDAWRAGRAPVPGNAADGKRKREPRWKKVEGAEAEQARSLDIPPEFRREVDGGVEIDIANLDFSRLTTTYREENEKAALGVMWAVERYGTANPRALAEFVHDHWVARNGGHAWTAAEQKVPFRKLSKEEKAKDVVFVDQALETLARVRAEAKRP